MDDFEKEFSLDDPETDEEELNPTDEELDPEDEDEELGDLNADEEGDSF